MPKQLLPNEFRRSGLVTIEMDRLEASLFAPKKLAVLDAEAPGRAMRDSVAIEDRWIAPAHRIDDVWEFEVEHDGVVTRIPGAVFKRLMDYRDQIIKEGRRRRGKAQAESRKNGARAEDLDADPHADPDFAAIQAAE